MKTDTPETDNYLPITTIRPILDHNPSGEWIPTDFARKLERERDEARRMWSIHQDKLAGLREQVQLTIMENLHLADGDVCTLKRLKDAIGFDLDSPENAGSMASPE